MGLRIAIITVGVFVCLGPTARALDLNDRTVCQVAVKSFDAKDASAARAIGTYITNTMEDLDQNHTNKGEPGIMARLTDDGVTSLVALAVAYCREHPRSTIYNASAVAYRGTRSMEMQMGVAK